MIVKQKRRRLQAFFNIFSKIKNQRKEKWERMVLRQGEMKKRPEIFFMPLTSTSHLPTPVNPLTMALAISN